MLRSPIHVRGQHKAISLLEQRSLVKSQIPSTKFQGNPKFQIPILNEKDRFGPPEAD
jgi:hypothetical protein